MSYNNDAGNNGHPGHHIVVSPVHGVAEFYHGIFSDGSELRAAKKSEKSWSDYRYLLRDVLAYLNLQVFLKAYYETDQRRKARFAIARSSLSSAIEEMDLGIISNSDPKKNIIDVSKSLGKYLNNEESDLSVLLKKKNSEAKKLKRELQEYYNGLDLHTALEILQGEIRSVELLADKKIPSEDIAPLAYGVEMIVLRAG